MSDKSLLLYAAGTPNSWKATIFVEELKAAYGDKAPAIEIQILDIFKGTQKEPWYLKINPNGRLPALVDRSRDDYTVFESAAIQLYLTEHYDKEHKLSFDPVTASNDYNDMMQWIFFAHGHVGPTLGEVFHYSRGTSEKVPYSLKRYTDETLRLFGVLDTRLKNREYLAGSGVGKYSIADMDAYPWVKSAGYVGINGLDNLPSLKAWLDRIDARPGAQSGMRVVPPAGSK
ncbi:glutathione S-transferase [Peniophora sp. CONT]|nr:glutathione S-transferase [Peniophora sp. CONT]